MTPGMGCQQDLGVILSNIAKGFFGCFTCTQQVWAHGGVPCASMRGVMGLTAVYCMHLAGEVWVMIRARCASAWEF
jgi:hypothetical protein